MRAGRRRAASAYVRAKRELVNYQDPSAATTQDNVNRLAPAFAAQNKTERDRKKKKQQNTLSTVWNSKQMAKQIVFAVLDVQTRTRRRSTF